MPHQYFIPRSIINTLHKVKPLSSNNYYVRHVQKKTFASNRCYLSIMPSSTPKSPYLFPCSLLSTRFMSDHRLTYNRFDSHKLRSSENDDEDDNEEDSDESSDQDIDDSVEETETEKEVVLPFHGVNSFTTRSHTCNELNKSHVGEEVLLYGWIEAKRGSNFIILRDGYGTVQICLSEYTGAQIDSPPESVLHVTGIVKERDAEHVNKEMTTGEVEIHPTEIKVLSEVKKKLPFSLKGYNMPRENLRLKHRYLHFRFPEMQRTLRLRSDILHKMRRYLVEDCCFVEVETPTLFGKTPGGAQEFVVPTKHKGKCYSLVQSPQQFKQMLMVGGIDRYFQVARCYRDEDSRSDRQPEFTQLDLEMSFTGMDGIMNLTEQILHHSWPKDCDDIGPLNVPFQRFKYSEVIADYGTDKPDLRYPMKIVNYTNFFTAFFTYRCDNNIRLLTYMKKGKCYSDELQKEADEIIKSKQSENDPATVKIFPFVNADSFLDILKPVLPEKAVRKLFNLLDGIQPGDLLVVGCGNEHSVAKILGALRVPIAKKCGMEPECRVAPLWVTHFPLLEKGPLIGKFKPVHHPFTNITKSSGKMFLGTPLGMTSLSYDLVINGQEIGGGSERIRDPDFQVKVLEKIGANPKDFDHFLNALSYGCPPHAGIALGVDRLLACLLDTDSIRDVIAFPKTVDGAEPLTGAPFTPSSADKARYKLK